MLNDFMVWVWLVIAMILFIVEASSVNMVSIWFGIAALLTVLPAYLRLSLGLQLVFFAVVSALLLASTRGIAKKILPHKETRENAQAIVGSSAIVLVDIDNVKGGGRVNIAGVDWWAFSANNQVIPQGTTVIVESISGAKVFVAETALAMAK